VSHLLVANVKHADAESAQRAVSFLVDVATVVMHATVHFDDQVSRWAEEVRDELPSNVHPVASVRHPTVDPPSAAHAVALRRSSRASLPSPRE
jgi:hypothetical protein